MNTPQVEEFMAASGLVPRSQSDLLALTPQFRWEFTRRHPYYTLFWRQALRWRRQESGTGNDEVQDGRCAVTLLEMIGVTGAPVDPALSFDELDCDLSQPVLGAVRPVTLRNMIDMLIAVLPPAELCATAAVLWNVGDKEYAVPDDSGHLLQRRKAHWTLMQMQSKVFDSYTDCPLYYVNVNASQRRIVRKWSVRFDV